MPKPIFLRALCLALSAAIAGCAADASAKKAKPPQPAAPMTAAAPDDAPEIVTYGRRDDVMRFGAEIAARHDLDPAWVRAALENARFIPNVAKFILPPPAGTAKNWAAYRSRFVEPIRIRAGLQFWRANEKWLKQAEDIYGVPPAIVVGIVGVESIYGQQMGGFRVVDALATLAFDFPAGRKDRAPFFRDELEAFFVMCHSEGTDPLAITGSYAGAMGMPQFMPSSFNKYAVDFDGDGHVDLRGNPADVIGSVAHYLAEFGWQRGLPTRFEVAAPVDVRDRALMLVPDILPSFSAQEFLDHGARLDPAALAFDARRNADAAASSSAASATPTTSTDDGRMKLALVELQNGSAAPSYVAGTANFYAITRYNWSSYYAMAVIDLGETVAREVARGGAR
jgi:membrane-bound lytic murein transglycosylase B